MAAPDGKRTGLLNASNRSERKALQAINEESSDEDEDYEEDAFVEPRKAGRSKSPSNNLEDLVDMRHGADEDAYFDKESVSLSSASPAPAKSSKTPQRAYARGDFDSEEDEDEEEDEPPDSQPADTALNSYLQKWGAKLNGQITSEAKAIEKPGFSGPQKTGNGPATNTA